MAPRTTARNARSRSEAGEASDSRVRHAPGPRPAPRRPLAASQQVAVAGRLQERERAGERLLDLGHLGAQREGGQQAVAPRRPSAASIAPRDCSRCRQAKEGSSLPALRAASSNAGWKPLSATPSIATIDVAIGFAAQIGDAVLGDDDVAQLPRHGGVGVAPDDVGNSAAVAAAGCCARR